MRARLPSHRGVHVGRRQRPAKGPQPPVCLEGKVNRYGSSPLGLSDEVIHRKQQITFAHARRASVPERHEILKR